VHATLVFDGCELAGSDVQPAHYQRPQGFSVLVDVEGTDNARRIFAALSAAGSVALPLQETFWSPAFAVLTDRFGIPWESNGTSSARGSAPETLGRQP
jgi:PhnB protein